LEGIESWILEGKVEMLALGNASSPFLYFGRVKDDKLILLASAYMSAMKDVCLRAFSGTIEYADFGKMVMVFRHDADSDISAWALIQPSLSIREVGEYFEDLIAKLSRELRSHVTNSGDA
jgi:hypothetical protein